MNERATFETRLMLTAAPGLLLAAAIAAIAVGLAGVGIDTDARVLIMRGARPLLLAFLATAFIALLSLSLVLIALSSQA